MSNETTTISAAVSADVKAEAAAILADAEATADPAYIEHAHQVAARARTIHGLEG